jgi:hypothetical protein
MSKFPDSPAFSPVIRSLDMRRPGLLSLPAAVAPLYFRWRQVGLQKLEGLS